MESIVSPTILKLEKYGVCFIAFRISYSTTIVECILQFWNGKENMRRLSKINVGFKKYKEETNPKSQDVYHSICRARDFERNKKILF